MKEFDLKSIELQDDFWLEYQRIVREKTIPYQYQVLNDAIDIDVQAERNDPTLPMGKSHALANFRIAAKQEEGMHFGWFFQDSDVYKWLESASYSLSNYADRKLEEKMDEVIALIASAQEEDGYLNTFFQLTRPNLKYRQLYFSHELYCAGHLIEAAIAYDQATGKKTLLEVAQKNIANIMKYFGSEPNQIQGADGHQEIELALVRLYEHTQKMEYLELADFFLEVRGKDPAFYQKEVEDNLARGLSEENPLIDLDYLQAYDQPKNQRHAKGHAVRMLYMASGMAKVAQYTRNSTLLEACKEIWTDIVCKKMYVTGGVGSTVHGEAFVGAYDLPNDTMYCETCAAIALVNFSFDMFKLTKEHKYLESLERALYNGVLSGAAIDGKHFFYVNPLEVSPESCRHNPDKGHVKTKRPDWLGCACCPPNFARLIESMQRFIYTQDTNALYVNLFTASKLKQNESFEIQQIGDFPFAGHLELRYNGFPQKVIVRKPSWLKDLTISSSNKWQEEEEVIIFEKTDSFNAILTFEQPVQIIYANPLVSQDVNQVAIQRGPFIYCLEEADNGSQLWRCRIAPDELSTIYEENASLLKRTITLTINGYQTEHWQTSQLYGPISEKVTPRKWQLIPYHLWGNRDEGEMRLWLPRLSIS